MKKYPKVRERNGKYYYRYDFKDSSTGKRKQKETKGFTTAKAAFTEGIRIEEEMRSGIYIDESRIFIHEWVVKWLDMYSNSGDVKNSTITSRKVSLKKLVRDLGMMRLKEISPFHYQEFLNNLKKEGLARSTVSTVHVTSKMLFKKAVQLKLITNDPTEYCKVPTYRKTIEELEAGELPKYLEKNELHSFLKALDLGSAEYRFIQFQHLFTILAYTGMRLGEIHALKWSDIDYENSQINITKTIDLHKGVELFELTPPKTKESNRKVDISDNVIKIIKKQEAALNRYKMLRRDEFKNHDFMFVNTGSKPGYPLAKDLSQIHFKKILSKAQLDLHYSPHSLRHTYTSLMAEANVSLPVIQRLLGHASSIITERVYLHVTKNKKKEAIDKLDELLGDIL